LPQGQGGLWSAYHGPLPPFREGSQSV